MMMKYQYELKSAIARKSTDLTCYESDITKAVQRVIGKNVPVKLTSSYYEFSLPAKLSLTQLQDIGKWIAVYVPELEDKKLAYDYVSSGVPTHSNQRFVRKNA